MNRLTKEGNAPIMMRVTVNGKRWDSALKVSIDPKFWGSRKRTRLRER